jgi:hypothetical protein
MTFSRLFLRNFSAMLPLLLRREKTAMKKFRVTFYIDGNPRQMFLFANHWGEAVQIVKLQFPKAYSVNAAEVH